MHSCIYEGRVTHCRYEPVVHKFWYRLFMAYLDLEELRTAPLLRSLVPQRRFAATAFLANDHLRGHLGSLEEKRARTGPKPNRPTAAGPHPIARPIAALGVLFQSPESAVLF